jgi:hypothetical protein
MSGAPQRGRRQFLGGLIAAGVLPVPSWADAGSPAYLAAGARADGTYLLCGIAADLSVLFPCLPVAMPQPPIRRDRRRWPLPAGPAPSRW